MICETIETLGAPGALASHEAVLRLYGPEPVHEDQAIVDALGNHTARARTGPSDGRSYPTNLTYSGARLHRPWGCREGMDHPERCTSRRAAMRCPPKVY
jgi:hypothetical protein